MAFPTLPQFDVRPENLYVVGVSIGDTPSTYYQIGQLASLDTAKQHGSRRFERVSNGSAEQYGPAFVTVRLGVYLAGNLEDLFRLLGFDQADWSNFTAELDPDKKVHIAIDGYDGTGSDATLVQQMTISDIKSMSVAGNLNPNNPSLAQINAEASEITIVPNPSSALVPSV